MKKSNVLIIFIIVVIVLVVVLCFVLRLRLNKTSTNYKDFGCREFTLSDRNYDKDLGNNYYIKNGLVYFIQEGGGEVKPYTCEMPTANPLTFQVLDFSYTKDDKHVFYNSVEIPGADSSTFKIDSSGNEATDKNYVYWGLEIMKGLDSQSFEDLGCKYMKTKDGIFIRNFNERDGSISVEKINGADIESFVVMKFGKDGAGYVDSKYDAKDKYHTYKYGVIVS